MTGARLNEVCSATWREFDLDNGLWTLPGRRRKNVKPGRLMPDHVMPLPGQLAREADCETGPRRSPTTLSCSPAAAAPCLATGRNGQGECGRGSESTSARTI